MTELAGIPKADVLKGEADCAHGSGAVCCLELKLCSQVSAHSCTGLGREDQPAPHDEQQLELLHQLQAYNVHVRQVGHSIEVQLVPAQLPCPMASQAGAWAIAHLRCQANLAILEAARSP